MVSRDSLHISSCETGGNNCSISHVQQQYTISITQIDKTGFFITTKFLLKILVVPLLIFIQEELLKRFFTHLSIFAFPPCHSSSEVVSPPFLGYPPGPSQSWMGPKVPKSDTNRVERQDQKC